MLLRRTTRVLLAILLTGVAASAARGGMAELGRKKTLTEAVGSDPAVGGGIVELTADGHLFSRITSPGDTVDSLLELLEGDINASGTGLVATHSSGAFVISVTHPPVAELVQLRIRTTDPGFGYVKAGRVSADTRGSVRAMTEAAKGTDDSGITPSQIKIVVNNLTPDRDVVVTLSPGQSAGSINSALLAALSAKGFVATLEGTEIVITRDVVMGQLIRAVEWEDNDRRSASPPGITSIGATSDCPPISGAAIPALSGLGVLALMATLAGAAIWRLLASS